ncbi:hypothetical protein [Nocardia sp. NPDC050435]|uniref:hypothetical protein n=1 Tax=Nocardia sp. NPDC050435 TaxID=3155040 RepID=UPI00340263DE
MAETILSSVAIGDYTEGTRVIADHPNSLGLHSFLIPNSRNTGSAAFENIRRAAVVSLPTPRRDMSGYWRAEGSVGGPAMHGSELDYYIQLGALAMAVKLKEAETPTLAEDLALVLKGSAANRNPAVVAAVERLQTAQTDLKISFR